METKEPLSYSRLGPMNPEQLRQEVAAELGLAPAGLGASVAPGANVQAGTATPASVQQGVSAADEKGRE